MLTDSRLQFGPGRSYGGASNTIVIQGVRLREIASELRNVTTVIDQATTPVLALAANPSETGIVRLNGQALAQTFEGA